MNPLINMMSNNGNMMSKIGPMVQMLKGNPAGAIQSMINSNPQAKQAWEQAQNMANGKSKAELEALVNNMAKEKGINVNELKSLLKK